MTWHVIRVRSKDAQKQLARTSLNKGEPFISYFSLRWEISSFTLSLDEIPQFWKKQNIKTLVAVFLWALALNASRAEKTSAEAEHDREKRWNLPDIDVSGPVLIFLRQLFVRDPFSFTN